MNELSFLVILLTKHTLDDETKEAVAARLIDISATFSHTPQVSMAIPSPTAMLASQVPSMQAIMARNPDLVTAPKPVAVENIAQTPATAAALASRSAAMMGVTDPSTGRKRKF